jgi:glycine cleavage system H lipoate-binding protein/TusA-related sulfurtransferase
MVWLTGPLGSVSFKQFEVEVPEGRGLGSIEGPRHFDVVRAPMTCRVIEFNERLTKDPRLLNRDPHGAGWFAKIVPVNLENGRPALRPIGEIQEQVRERITTLGVHCFSEYPDYEMFEIGVECSAVLVTLNDLLSRSQKGTVVHVVSDDPTAELEMMRWMDQTGQALLESRREGKLYHFIVKKVK